MSHRFCRCPRCGSRDARAIRRWRVGDYFAVLTGRRPFVCQICRRRFRSIGRPAAPEPSKQAA